GADFFYQSSPPKGEDFVAVSTGGINHPRAEPRFSGLALRADGSIVGFGWDDYGQATPPRGSDFTAITATAESSFGLKADGSIVGWGGMWQILPPPEGKDFAAIAGGTYHCLALRKDGSIVGWGDNSSSQVASPSGNDFIAISARANQSLAIRRAPCQYTLPGDLNGDCRVGFADFGLMAGNWLVDCYVTPEDAACVPK
ncbi:MAG: RCC1 domain-containing protein, partial [Planctomycetota bacterium]